MNNNFIQIKNLQTNFNGKIVHNNLNLNIKKGETMVVIGTSGSGKSVLLKTLIGLIKPSSGKIIIEGFDFLKIDKNKKNQFIKQFGVLFQGAALFDSLNVGENVAFSLRHFTSFSKKKIQKIVNQKLSLVGLSNIQKFMPFQLSGGMKKRVGLARALVMNPKIILYDEPTTGLDLIMANVINNLILQLQNENNVTSLVVTHDMDSAFKVANRIALLKSGKIIALGKPNEIINSNDLYVQQFIQGKSKSNEVYFD